MLSANVEYPEHGIDPDIGIEVAETIELSRGKQPILIESWKIRFCIEILRDLRWR